MSPHKIGGCCSLCDEPVFEVTAVWESGTPRAGEPKSLGAANDGAIRVSFLLLAGGYTDMTFCGECAASLSQEHYTLLWRKNLAGYLREQIVGGGDHQRHGPIERERHLLHVCEFGIVRGGLRLDDEHGF